MAISDHAEIPPSSADQIEMCPGSRKFIAMYPKDDTIESREGTAAHWALAELLSGCVIDVGQVAPNGVTLNAEMVECAELVSDYIAARDGINMDRRALPGVPRITDPRVMDRVVETTIRNNFLHDKNWGTPDLVERSSTVFFYDDYKHGHKYVEVYRRKQLINYALMDCAELIAKGITIPLDFPIVLTIHQPRSYHRNGPHRSWAATYGELLEFVPRMRSQFALSMRDDAPVIPADPLICEHCPGRHVCEGAISMGYSAYEHAFSSVPLQMSPAAMGLELKILKRAAAQLKARISGMEDAVKEQMQRPGGVPGWRVEFTSGRLAWDDTISITTIINASKALGLDVAKPGIITPTQAKKLGMPEPLLLAWSDKRVGSVELVQDDGTLAARVFSS